ncbi:hypothetical protein R6Q59_014597 [Mikania micrantha]
MASPVSPHPLITSTTMHASEPSNAGTDQQRHVGYDIVFALIVLLFIIILIYTTYLCNRIKDSQSPPTTADSDTDDDDNFNSTVVSGDHVSFPTFVYSEILKRGNATATDDTGCHICLTDYESVDVLRMLPECGHLFHVGCVDTWLKVHPTCPVCRNSPLQISSEMS